MEQHIESIVDKIDQLEEAGYIDEALVLYNKLDELLEGDMRRIYLDLSGTHGNSGSAVIDVSSARVIGIFSGASVDRNANAEINFAIPTSYIWDLINKTTKE